KPTVTGATTGGTQTGESELSGTDFCYSGELGTDLWAAGKLWGALVARSWEQAVQESVLRIKEEAERVALVRKGRLPGPKLGE
ncbi:MAG: hypothetical protein ACRD1G_15425, partial [Acidimicrobiales bacterium]